MSSEWFLISFDFRSSLMTVWIVSNTQLSTVTCRCCLSVTGSCDVCRLIIPSIWPRTQSNTSLTRSACVEWKKKKKRSIAVILPAWLSPEGVDCPQHHLAKQETVRGLGGPWDFRTKHLADVFLLPVDRSWLKQRKQQEQPPLRNGNNLFICPPACRSLCQYFRPVALTLSYIALSSLHPHDSAALPWKRSSKQAGWAEQTVQKKKWGREWKVTWVRGIRQPPAGVEGVEWVRRETDRGGVGIVGSRGKGGGAVERRGGVGWGERCGRRC